MCVCVYNLLVQLYMHTERMRAKEKVNIKKKHINYKY